MTCYPPATLRERNGSAEIPVVSGLSALVARTRNAQVTSSTLVAGSTNPLIDGDFARLLIG